LRKAVRTKTSIHLSRKHLLRKQEERNQNPAKLRNSGTVVAAGTAATEPSKTPSEPESSFVFNKIFTLKMNQVFFGIFRTESQTQ
jgi:hypothetical protein